MTPQLAERLARPAVLEPSLRASARWPRFLRSYAIAHGVWLVLDALLGKGFAHAGWGSFYVGELLLLLSIPAMLVAGRLGTLARTPLGVVMMGFLAWHTARMLPYWDDYGLDALRDSVIWGYAVFAWVMASLVLRLPLFLRTVVGQYRIFCRWYLFLGPLGSLATQYFSDWLPRWPETTITIPLIKGGELCTHLAGVLAFSSAGLAPTSQWWLLLNLAGALLAMNARGGLLAFVVASCFALIARPRFDRFMFLIGSGLLLVVGMAALDLRVNPPKSAREFSLDQLASSVVSIVTDSGRSELEATKAWRLGWWGKIWDYTVDGPYFWTGKGYGINLADSDGFQVGTRDEPLRSPHSSHLTFLARSGVPGFLLWVALQSTWAVMIFSCFLKARRMGAGEWTGLFAWLLAYWLAFLIAAGFDVFLEGPMAGIPFWTVFGLGWGSVTLFRSRVRTWQPQAF